MSKNQATSSFLSHFFWSQRFGCQFSKATYACHCENFIRLNLNNVWFRLGTYTGLSTSLLCTTTKLGLFPIIKFWSLKRKGQRRKESHSIIKHMFHVHPFFPAKAFQINSWYVCSIMSSWWCITAYRQQRLLMPTCFFFLIRPIWCITILPMKNKAALGGGKQSRTPTVFPKLTLLIII